MKSDKLIKITLVVSFVVHGLFLALPAFNLDSSRPESPAELSLRIEIEEPSRLPRIKKIGQKKKLQNVIEEPQDPPLRLASVTPAPAPVMEPPDPPAILPAIQPAGKRVEVSNPVDEAMLRYQDIIKERIEEVKEYSEWAREQGLEGIIRIGFTISSDGNSRGIKLIHSSGSKILDRTAVDTIKRALPFPPFPEELARPFIQMEVSLVFTLK